MDAALVLILSILALVAGAVTHRLARGWVAGLVDGFVVMALCGLILVHVLPDAFAEAGWMAMVAALVGIGLPYFLERIRPSQDMSGGLLLLVAAGLSVHLFLDGAVLATGAQEHAGPSGALSAAVVLHRFPVGLSLWLFVRKQHQQADVLRLIGVVVLATVLGFVVGDRVLSTVPASTLYVFQALVAGSLLHVVLEARPEAAEGAGVRPAALGGLLGVGLVMLFGHAHAPAEGGLALGFRETLVTLALVSAPFLLAGYALAAVAHAALPRRWRRVARGPSSGLAPMQGLALTLFRPVSTCAAPRAYRTLDALGASPGAALSFLMAIPLLSYPALLLSVPLLGLQVAGVRLVAGVFVALAVGYAFIRAKRSKVAADSAEEEPEQLGRTLESRLIDGAQFGFGELVDHTAPWILFGLLMAAVLEPMLEPRALQQLSPPIQVPLATAAALPFYMCAAGATPLVALLMHKGLTVGAGVAMLIAGPAMTTPVFQMLSERHGRGVAVLVLVLVAGIAAGTGFGVNAWLESAAAIDLHAAVASGASWPQYASFVAVALLIAVSYVRRGPRRFVHMAFAPHGHEHAHGELHGGG